MPDSPLVSVIVPTHNRPDFLKKTLLSIIGQTYTNLEIFVISNGENPLNKEIVDSLDDRRITYRDQKNSGGPSSPRNHGIRLSSGKYLAFCDDDDIWIPTKIEKQVKALEKNLNYGLCYTKMMRFDETKEWTVIHEEGASCFETLLYVNTIPISAVMIRKECVNVLGGFSEDAFVGASEDYEFLLRYAVTNKFYFIDEYLIRYWSGNNRTTDFEGHARKLWTYYGCILSIFNHIRKHHHLSSRVFIRPVFYHFSIIAKILIHKGLSVLGVIK